MSKYLLNFHNRAVTAPPPTLTILTNTISNGVQGTPYPSTSFQASGGLAPYTWLLVSPDNVLPTGMTFTAGVLSGTPTVAGSFPLNFRVLDSASGEARTGVINFSVASASSFVITTTSLPSVVRGTAYSTTLATVNGTGAVVYELLAPYNTLPTGLLFNTTTGVLSGTPTVVGTTQLSFRATDSLGTTAYSGILNITVSQVAALLIITASELAQGEVGAVYRPRTFVTSGGWSTITWAVVSGAIPTGMSFNASTGVLSGTPTTVATYIFDLSATDTEARTNTKRFSLNVVAAGTLEGPDDYFNQWSVHGTTQKAVSLKTTTSDVRTLQAQPTLANSPWSYDPGSDTHPEAQDAAKLVIDRFNAAGTRLWSIQTGHQLYMRLSPVVAAPDSVLYSWDWYWTQDFLSNRGDVYAYKTWQTRPTTGAGWWTHLQRMYADNEVRYFDACRSGSQGTFAPAGVIDAGNDRYVPLGPGVESVPTLTGELSQDNYHDSWEMKTSVFTRFWIEIKFGQPPAAFTAWNTKYGVTVGANVCDMTGAGRWNMLSMWAADENREVQRLLYQMPIGFGNNSDNGTVASGTTTSITRATKLFDGSIEGRNCMIEVNGVPYYRVVATRTPTTITFTVPLPGVPLVTDRFVIDAPSFLPQMAAFTYEMNTSKVGPVAPLVGYGRHWMLHKNYTLTTVPEDDPIFRKPVR